MSIERVESVVETTVVMGQNVTVESSVAIRPGVVIGDYVTLRRGCFLDENVQVGNYVAIGDNTYVGKGVVVGDYARIGSDCVIEDGVVIPPNVDIYPGAYVASGRAIRPYEAIKTVRMRGLTITIASDWASVNGVCRSIEEWRSATFDDVANEIELYVMSANPERAERQKGALLWQLKALIMAVREFGNVWEI